MLGKGLESLIPQKGGQGNTPGQNSNVNPGGDQAQAPVQPQTQPQPQPEAQFQPQPQSPAQPQPQPQPEPPKEPVLLPVSHADREAAIRKVFDTKQTAERKEVVGDSVFHIEVERIKANPNQPRRQFDQAALRDLANSIREFGILQPLVVSKVETETPTGIAVEYQLIAGERRFMAAKMLGLPVVPAIVRNVNLEREKLELAVIENIQRENLNPIETARAFERLQEEFRMTQREIAAKLGKSREVVANTMRLLDLPEYVRDAVEKGEISESHARLLLAITDPGAQKRLFDDIVQNKLTTRDVKERVQMYSGAKRGRPPLGEEHVSPEMRAIQEELSSSLGAPVEIRQGAANGKITITFFSEEELANILKRLGKQE